MQDDQAKILNPGLLELALLQFEVELVLAETFQDKVYTHYTLCNEVPEDVVHHCLEGGWAIGESKEHNKRFKQSLVGLEGGLPFVSLLDMHIVVAPPDVQFSEVLHTLEVVDELGDEGRG
ncbi:hypothetical protein C0989_008950 [Termitomyces sp. Mn162]|nr:hypothetical protein C0989_008950 [Termitomyces sp. Mn162]